MRLESRFLALLALLLAAPAFAQRVVILEIDGDSTHRLRAQIENAVRSAATVEVVPLQAFKDAAVKRKIKGAAAFTPAGVARTSKSLRFDAAVTGEVDGNTYKVLIWDRTGKELWTRELVLKRGLLSEDLASKLSRAITAAAEQGAAKADPNAGAEEGEVGVDLSGGEPEVATPPPGRRRPAAEDPNRDADLDAQSAKRATEIAGPPLIRGALMVASTLRYQCLRPGVTSCRDYDQLTTKPQGIVIDFSAPSPYWGFGLGAELYPLHAFRSQPVHRFFNGLGLLLGLNVGFSQIRLVEQTPQGQGAPVTIASTDIGYSFELVYRIHFAMGLGTPQQPIGYVGLRGGLQSRNFNIDPNSGTSLPSSQRTSPTGFGHPVLGLDVAIPIIEYFRLEAGFSLYVSPRPSNEQIIGYGNLQDPTGGAVSSGFGLEAGASGTLWGPIGYVAKVKFMSFNDQFKGLGQKWTVCDDTQCGGVGEESYTQFLVGITAKY